MIVRKISGIAGLVVLLFSGSLGAGAVLAQDQGAIDQAKVWEEQEKNTEYLLAQSLAKAKTLMERNGDFLPFGAALFVSGDVRYVWTQDPDQPAQVKPPIALAAVKRGLQANAQRGRVLGVASVYRYTPADENGNRLEPQINVEVEYVTGHAFVVAVDYEMEDGVFTAGKAVRREIQGQSFTGKPDGEVVIPETEEEAG